MMMMMTNRKKFPLSEKEKNHLLRSQLKRIRSKKLRGKRNSKSLKLKRPQR
jgi:hypothetical protein